MKAARIHSFGPPDVIVIDDQPRPSPGADQVLVRVASAGVGPWDALIRENKSVVNSPLPHIL
jgi:NADPH:quinone reductase-like Zn-dependent oxidoreductase